MFYEGHAYFRITPGVFPDLITISNTPISRSSIVTDTSLFSDLTSHMACWQAGC